MNEVANGWYIPTPDPKGRRRLPRWVLGTINGVIRYSKGGSEHFMCSPRTFQKWVKQYGAWRADSDPS